MAATYQLSPDPDVILKPSEHLTIPKESRFWDEYQEWLAAGNTPDPYEPLTFD
ncbi:MULTISPECIES: hypothetical protein [unclassified Pseudomonas]|uniref:hypothetical protein n=1 Tax=unclassified Pseudomonas TaxID=196821 RepID=UPI003CF6D068